MYIFNVTTIEEAEKLVKLYDDPADVVVKLRDDVEASLRRLNTDYIDLYQFHVNEYDPEKAGAVRDTLETLVADGKIRCTRTVDGGTLVLETALSALITTQRPHHPDRFGRSRRPPAPE